MTLTRKISNHNFYAFLWHAGFLALAKNFMDIDTVIPAMLIESGGGTIHIGLMTVIILGGSSFTQLFFAPYLSNWPFKKKFMLAGINSRILSLFALGFILIYLREQHNTETLLKRKTFFSAKQIIAGSVVLISAFVAKKILTASGYPVNYAYMFFIGGALLLIASGGFWKIKESIPSMLKIDGFKDFIKTLKSELIKNNKLFYYLGFINTQGIIISFLPFVILYAKEIFNTQSSDIGSFLLFKVIGIVTVSMLIFLAANKVKYSLLLYLNVTLSVILILTTLLINYEAILKYVFIFGGVVVTLYNITMNGLLLEVSDRSNRALYTGFAGAGHILPALFPLAGSWIINRYGFQPFFLIFMLIILSSLFFIPKLDCKR